MSDDEEPTVTPKSLFDKKRCQLCICIEVTDNITNEEDLQITRKRIEVNICICFNFKMRPENLI